MRHASSLLRRAVWVAGTLLLSACRSGDPAAPVATVTPLVQHGVLALRASFLVPPGRGPGDSIVVEVTMHNTGAESLRLTTTPGCEISVRLLSAAAGAGASATFYDDFQRPCVRMLKELTVGAGATIVVRHAIPVAAIPATAPREQQAHVGVQLDGTIVLLTGGTFTLR